MRSAETKSLSAISNEMKDFAARARARKLKPHEYQGGTTAVSNLGMYGIKDFTAVINPPHATILAVGRRRGAGRRRQRQDRGRACDERDAVVRSPGGRRRARRRADRRVQEADRKSGDDGGVSAGHSGRERKRANRNPDVRQMRAAGFRAPRFARSRNDGEGEISF